MQVGKREQRLRIEFTCTDKRDFPNLVWQLLAARKLRLPPCCTAKGQKLSRTGRDISAKTCHKFSSHALPRPPRGGEGVPLHISCFDLPPPPVARKNAYNATERVWLILWPGLVCRTLGSLGGVGPGRTSRTLGSQLGHLGRLTRRPR